MPPTSTRVEVLERVVDRLIEATTVREKDRLTFPLEAHLTREVGRVFEKQGRSFLRAFASLKPLFTQIAAEALLEAPRPRDWEIIWERTAASLASAMRIELDRAYRAALLAGGVTATRGVPFDVAFDLRNPRAERWLQYRAADRVTAINSETRNQLRTLLKNAGAEGWSYDRTAKAIKDRFEGFSGPPLRGFLPPGPVVAITSRAQMVAVTEIGDAYEAGNRIVADDLGDAGIPMEKKWLTPGDSRVCPKCSGNASQGWIPLEEEFQSGDGEPLAHPGCRCTAEYQVREGDLPKTPEGKPKVEAPDEAAEKERLRARKSTTVEEAEERARALVGKRGTRGRVKNPEFFSKTNRRPVPDGERMISYQGIHPELADKLTDHLEAFAEEFPAVADDIVFYGNAKWFYKDVQGITTKISDEAIAESFQGRGIAFNETYFGNLLMDEKVFGRASGFHPTNITVNPYDDVITHELGHRLFYPLEYDPDALGDLYAQLRAIDKKYAPTHGASLDWRSQAWTEVSKYARQSRHEFIAECWTEYRNAPNPRRVAKLVGEFLERRLKGVTERGGYPT